MGAVNRSAWQMSYIQGQAWAGRAVSVWFCLGSYHEVVQTSRNRS